MIRFPPAPVNLFCRGGFFIVALRAASGRVRTSTDTTNQMIADLQDSIARHFTAKLGVTSVQLEFREEDFGFDNSLTVRVNGTPFDVFYTAANEITLSCPA